MMTATVAVLDQATVEILIHDADGRTVDEFNGPTTAVRTGPGNTYTLDDGQYMLDVTRALTRNGYLPMGPYSESDEPIMSVTVDTIY